MSATGIICEYNPFHTGHAYQLEYARRDTAADTLIAVMSEHVVQRGEIAVADAYVRAEAAVRAGADLVVGLPFPYSAAPAEFFALSAVRLLNALGATALHFGSESGDLEALQALSRRTSDEPFLQALTAYQGEHPNLGVLECRDAVYQALYGQSPSVGSNDLLAISYLQALRRTDSTMTPYTIKRLGQDYNDDCPPTALHPSASALRALWQKKGLSALESHLPAPVLQTLQRAADDGLCPLDEPSLSAVFLAYFRLTPPAELSHLEALDGGLAERLCAAAQRAPDLSTLLTSAATRRYTDARLRRALWYGLCGITHKDVTSPPAFVRVLAANERGCAHLSAMRRRCSLPIVTKPADLPTDAASLRQADIDARVHALIAMTLPCPKDAAFLLRRRPYIQTNRQE